MAPGSGGTLLELAARLVRRWMILTIFAGLEIVLFSGMLLPGYKDRIPGYPDCIFLDGMRQDVNLTACRGQCLGFLGVTSSSCAIR